MDVKKKILIVDDEAVVRDALEKILGRESYEVFSAVDGEEVISYMENVKFDLIILDLVLPGIDGIETLRKIREIDTMVPVILLSAYLTSENIEKAQSLGLNDHIAKPFKLEELTEKVAKAINK